MEVVKDFFNSFFRRKSGLDRKGQVNLSYRYTPNDEVEDLLATPFADQFERMVSYVAARQDEANEAYLPFTTAVLPMLSRWMEDARPRLSNDAHHPVPLELQVSCVIPLAVPPFHSVAASTSVENEVKVLEGDAAIVSSFVLDFLPSLAHFSVSHHSEINADVVRRWEMFFSQVVDELCASRGLPRAPLVQKCFRGLTTLDMSYTSLGDDGVAYLVLLLWPAEVVTPGTAAAVAAEKANALLDLDQLEGLPRLRVLLLDAVGMTARGFEALYRSLQNYSVRLAQYSIAASEKVYLEHLSVAGNYINATYAVLGSRLVLAQRHSGRPLILGYNISFNSIYNKNAAKPRVMGEFLVHQPVTEPVEELLQLNGLLQKANTSGGDSGGGSSIIGGGVSDSSNSQVRHDVLQAYIDRQSKEVVPLKKIKVYLQGGNVVSTASKDYISAVLAHTIRRGRPARLLALLASQSSELASTGAAMAGDTNSLDGSTAVPSPSQDATATMSPREFLFEQSPSAIQQMFLRELCLPTFTRITCLDFSYNTNIKDEAVVMLLCGIFALEASSCCYADKVREHRVPMSTEVVKLVYHPLIFLEEFRLRHVGCSASSLSILVALLSVWEPDETIEEMKERQFIPQTFYERRHHVRGSAVAKKRNYFTLTPQRAMTELLRYINREAARELQKGEDADKINKELNIQLRHMFEEVELFHCTMADDQQADGTPPRKGSSSSAGTTEHSPQSKKTIFNHTFLLPHLRLLDLSENDLSVQMDPWQERSLYAAPSSVIAAFLCKALTLAQQDHDVIQVSEEKVTPLRATPGKKMGTEVEHFTLFLENCHLDDLTLLETAILYQEAMRVAPQVATPVRAPPSFTLYLGHNKFTQDALVAFRSQTENFFSYFISCSEPVSSYVNGFVEGNFVFGPSSVASPTPPPPSYAMPNFADTVSPDAYNNHLSLWFNDARVSWNLLITEDFLSGFRVPSHVTQLFPFRGGQCPQEPNGPAVHAQDAFYATSPLTSTGSNTVLAERLKKAAARTAAVRPTDTMPTVVLDHSLLSHLVEESAQLMSERIDSLHRHSDGDETDEDGEKLSSGDHTSTSTDTETDMVALLRQPLCAKAPPCAKKETE